MLLPSDANLCPTCRGCMPGEGPPARVCRCGSAWGPPLRELIRLLDEALTDPGPPDFPTPTTDKIASDEEHA